MDLKDNKITMGELLSDRRAKAILKKEFPQFTNPLMLQMSKGMALADVLSLAAGRVPADQVERTLRELQEL